MEWFVSHYGQVMRRFDSLLYRTYMVVLPVVCCICIHWCIVFTMHVWGVLCIYGLFYVSVVCTMYLWFILCICCLYYWRRTVCTIDTGLFVLLMPDCLYYWRRTVCTIDAGLFVLLMPDCLYYWRRTVSTIDAGLFVLLTPDYSLCRCWMTG